MVEEEKFKPVVSELPVGVGDVEAGLLSSGGSTGSAGEILLKTLDSSSGVLPMIARNGNPKGYALVMAKAAFCDKYVRTVGGKRGGDFRRDVVSFCLMFETSRMGKGNRADAVIDAAKALLQQENEVERSAGGRVMSGV